MAKQKITVKLYTHINKILYTQKCNKDAKYYNETAVNAGKHQ